MRRLVLVIALLLIPSVMSVSSGSDSSGLLSQQPSSQTIDESGISISIPADVLGEGVFDVAPAIAEGTMFPRPEGRRIAFPDYPIERQFGIYFIDIYPVEPLRTINDVAAEELDALEGLFRNRPIVTPTTEELPWMSSTGASNSFAFKGEYLDFDNGSALRYITRFTQNIGPVNADSLVYVVQGITDDGQYALSVILPFTTEILPDSDEYVDSDAFGLFLDYANTVDPNEDQIFVINHTFNLGTAYALHSAPTELFTPDITVLDDMIRSLSIAAPGD